MNKKKAINPFLFGCILGDAYINPYGTITIEHSVKQQEYLFWKYEKFQAFRILSSTSKPTVVSRIHPKTKKESQSLRFNTKRLFQAERDIFYPKGRKILPECFEECCQLESLAIWYMDDGGRGGNTPFGMVLDISAYSLEEILRISFFFQKSWGIYTSIHNHGKKGAKKLYIKRESAELFCSLIRPFIIKSMVYKLAC